MVIEAFAPAKINLTLHVTGQRPDGYHLLDSLAAFADVGDRISLRPSAALSLQVTGPEAAGVPMDDSNLALKAARFFGAGGGAIALEKNLPAAAGIGGGSSDAAAVLRAFSDMTGREIPAGALALGADVPVCLRAGAVRMAGIGDLLSPVPSLPPLWCVLVNPRIAVATPDVFSALAQKANPPMPEAIPAFATAQALGAWLKGQRNDLEHAAIRLQPRISVVLNTLATLPGAMLHRMSGSGATCFALFADDAAARAAATRLSHEFPGWWVRAAALS